MVKVPAGPRRAVVFALFLLLCSPAVTAGGQEKSTDLSFSLDKGLRLTAFEDKLRFTMGARFDCDFGRIDADDGLQASFPGLDGFHEKLRRLRSPCSPR